MTDDELNKLKERQHDALAVMTPNDLLHFKFRLRLAQTIAADPRVTEGPWFRTPYASTRLCTKDDKQVLVCSTTRDNKDFEAADQANTANGLFVMLARAMLVPLLNSASDRVNKLASELLLHTVDGQATGRYCETSEYHQLRSLWLELKDCIPK